MTVGRAHNDRLFAAGHGKSSHQSAVLSAYKVRQSSFQAMNRAPMKDHRVVEKRTLAADAHDTVCAAFPFVVVRGSQSDVAGDSDHGEDKMGRKEAD